VRLQALQALASFGPDAAVAVPELMALAMGTDATLSAQALKVLGVVGKAVAPHLAQVSKLGKQQDEVGRIARSLVARLRAMGVAPPPDLATVATTLHAEVALAAAGLGAGDAAATATAQRMLRSDRDLAFAALVARFRAERSEAPDAVVLLLAEFAGTRGEADRDTLRYAIASLPNDTWQGPMMSSSSGVGGERRPVHFEAYGRLLLGDRTDFAQLVEGLAADDAMVRFVAARLLAAQPAEVAAATPAGELARTALLHALAAEAPSKVSLESGPQQRENIPVSFLPQLYAAIAIALADCTLPVEPQSRLFDHVLDAGCDPTLVAAALRRYGAAATDAAVARAIADPRPAVAAAAREVLAARSGGK
jgi:dihydroxyacetone kinase